MINSAFGVGRYNGDIRECVTSAVKNFKNPKLILFFSDETHFCEYAETIHNMFPDAVSIGCSAYRTWSSSGTYKNTLTAASFEDGITCSAGVIEKADSFSLSYAENVSKCMDEIKETDNTICIEFTVPYKHTEEYSIMTLNSVLLRHEIPVIGGTAANVCADKTVSEDAYVALNGKIYSEGCVFAIIHSLSGKISLYSENIYRPLTGREFTVTKANSETRTIISCDNKPTAEVYAKELNVPLSDISKYFSHYPMGQCVGDATYVTAIQGEGNNGSLKFHARVHESTKMMIMKEGDYKNSTLNTINRVKDEFGTPPFVLMFHCVARTILFEENGYLSEYQRHLSEAFPNFIGIACLGEQFGTKNFNHTMMLAVFE